MERLGAIPRSPLRPRPLVAFFWRGVGARLITSESEPPAIEPDSLGTRASSSLDKYRLEVHVASMESIERVLSHVELQGLNLEMMRGTLSPHHAHIYLGIKPSLLVAQIQGCKIYFGAVDCI